MCFVWIWEQTAIISLYSFYRLVFITETGCIYCAVRTEYIWITLLLAFHMVNGNTANVCELQAITALYPAYLLPATSAV